MQENAITKKEGPCVILAGAGTGKTYTIIEKLKHLISNKTYEPERIVCLTFSNEAVNSLKTRVNQSINPTKEPIIRTFHSFCADLLKEHGESIGIAKDFRIIIPDEAKIVLHKNLKLNPNLCSKYIDTIGIAKDLGITADSILNYVEENKKKEYSDDLQKSVESAQFELNTRHALRRTYSRNEVDNKRDRLKRLSQFLKLQRFAKLWKAYDKIKERRNLLDYADLNAQTIRVLKKIPEIAKNYDYIIVDEFQDTNKMQFDLLVLLAPHKNITVVGDLNQSIYRFRGAYKENISKFKELFGVNKEDIYALDKSYRSPNKVLNIASKLIQNEENYFLIKNAFDREGDKVKVIELKNDKEETRKILEIIEEEKNKVPLEEICVMFRTHSQSQRLKRVLEENKIPFTAVVKTSLFELNKIKKIINYLIISDLIERNKSGGEQAWWDLFNSYNVNKEDLSMIGRELKKLENTDCPSKTVLEILSKSDINEQAKATANLIKINLEKIETFRKDNKNLLELIETINGFDLTSEEKIEETLANYTKFKSWIEEYTKTESQELSDLVYHIGIIRKLGIIVEIAKTDKGGVRIMTNHATKGLEYKIVIVTNMAQHRFPAERSRANDLIPAELMPDLAEQLKDAPTYAKDEILESFEKKIVLAEERRLAYVSFTRAKERLYLTFAREYGSRSYGPSQFLTEIEYTKNENIEFIKDEDEKSTTKEPIIESASEIDSRNKKIRRKTTFSPSALLLFSQCQKKYEYKYVYNMPEKEPTSWEEIRLGSFVHKIIEEGVKNNFTSEEDFIKQAKLRYSEEEWNQVNLDDAITILRIFYQRNKNKYTKDSLTEKKLRVEIDNIIFEGYADRIDIHSEGLEIIDYKTGKAYVTAQHRNWQLGIYALAARELGLGPVKRLTLDMLRHEKPSEFELRDDGIAYDVNSTRTSFNLNAIKDELVKTAKEIQSCYEKGFSPCDIEDNCEFCNEFIWKV